MTRQKVVPFLWFDGKAGEAARFYISVFGEGRIIAETPVTTSFELRGQEYGALNGGPMYQFSEATSFMIRCSDQAEVDHFWNALTADGGKESMCAWLKDKYGVSWQVVPDKLIELMSDPDRGRAERATQAMLKMRKIVIADLEAAANG
jgi:predicted 3-demethylubiquinone-9 3-methyltransferase (glyoxalase superfamily)